MLSVLASAFTLASEKGQSVSGTCTDSGCVQEWGLASQYHNWYNHPIKKIRFGTISKNI
jgi:hypothetical protein